MKIYIYRATSQNGDVSTNVVSDPSNWGCLTGYDKNGEYQQVDSTEMYHSYSWGDCHGIKVECVVKEIEVTEEDFKS